MRWLAAIHPSRQTASSWPQPAAPNKTLPPWAAAPPCTASNCRRQTFRTCVISQRTKGDTHDNEATTLPTASAQESRCFGAAMLFAVVSTSARTSSTLLSTFCRSSAGSPSKLAAGHGNPRPLPRRNVGSEIQGHIHSLRCTRRQLCADMDACVGQVPPQMATPSSRAI
ncbi:hypothetical protein ACJQWK_07306 [Exserohilum turcicum]